MELENLNIGDFKKFAIILTIFILIFFMLSFSRAQHPAGNINKIQNSTYILKTDQIINNAAQSDIVN